MHRRLTRTLLVALAVAALAAAGIVANFVLLEYADSRNDPVGRLTPRADIAQPASPRKAEDEHGDEGGGDADD